MERPPGPGGDRPVRASNRISKRVLGNWERVVAKAVREQGRAIRGRPEGPSAGVGGSSYSVPQSLAQQADINAVMQAADEIESENRQVARIRTCSLTNGFTSHCIVQFLHVVDKYLCSLVNIERYDMACIRVYSPLVGSSFRPLW